MEAGAYFYVCGRTGLAKTVMNELPCSHPRAAVGPEKAPGAFLPLGGEDRYLQEIFTTYPGPQTGGAACITHPRSRCTTTRATAIGWSSTAASTTSASLPTCTPAGLKIIQSYAGMDAAIAYRRVQHDVNPEVKFVHRHV